MSKKFFQGMSIVLSVTMFAQVTFGNLALAQQQTTPQPGQSSAPFWMGDNGVTVGDPNKAIWGNGDDPWNIGGSDPWNNGGIGNGNWGDPTGGTDPWGANNYWSTGGFGTMNWYDNIFVTMLRATGVLNKPYTALIHEIRENGAYDNDDALADAIITKYSKYAASIGGAITFLTAVPTFFLPSLNNNSAATWGLFGTQMSADWVDLFKQQSTMILALAELYGGLPADPDEKMAHIMSTYLVAASQTGASKLFHPALQKWLQKLILGDLVQTTTQPAIGAAAAALIPAVTVAANELGQEIPAQIANATAKEVTVNLTKDSIKEIVGKQVTSNTVQLGNKGLLARFLNDKQLQIVAPVAQKIIPVVAAGITAGITYGADYYATKRIGLKAKAKYKAEQVVRLGKTIHALKANSKAKGTLWLLLTRDVFPRMMDQKDPDKNENGKESSKKFAAILSAELPLVKNNQWDERDALVKAFQANPKLIDENLLEMRDELTVDAKLYLMKLLIAGMAMKGGLDPKDNKTLKTVSIELGLWPPTPTAAAQLKATDPRIDARDRYIQMKTAIEQAVATREKILGSKEDSSNKKIKARAYWGSAGQIILEDFETAAPVIGLHDAAAKSKGLTTTVRLQAQKTADTLSSAVTQ